jgi:hypothetical protein
MSGASAMNDASAAELLRGLRGLVESGRIRIELDFRRLDHMDSPVGVEADSNIWVYAAIPLCGLVFWQLGLWPGVAAVAVCLAVYFTVGRAYVHRRLTRRVYGEALKDSELWRKLWRFGGVALVIGEGGAATRCAAPEGNWMALVRRLATSADASGADAPG